MVWLWLSSEYFTRYMPCAIPFMFTFTVPLLTAICFTVLPVTSEMLIRALLPVAHIPVPSARPLPGWGKQAPGTCRSSRSHPLPGCRQTCPRLPPSAACNGSHRSQEHYPSSCRSKRCLSQIPYPGGYSGTIRTPFHLELIAFLLCARCPVYPVAVACIGGTDACQLY